MKKLLLSFGLLLVALGVNAQGQITDVGTQVELVPSTYWGTAKSRCWKAMAWIYNSKEAFGDMNTSNPNYISFVAEASEDWNGKQWYDVDFDPSQTFPDINNFTGEEVTWSNKSAPFSYQDTYTSNSITVTTGCVWCENNIMGDICLRRTFTAKFGLDNDIYLACGHDDSPCEYYINGTLIWSRTGYEEGNGWLQSQYVQLTDAQKALIHNDGVTENVFAIHIHQNWGGAFADGGFYLKFTNYDDAVEYLNDVIALGEDLAETGDLTAPMKAEVEALVSNAKSFSSTDVTTVGNYARDLYASLDDYTNLSYDVTALRQTIAICENDVDNGYLEEALTNAKNNIESCTSSSDISNLLDPLRAARKLNNLERRNDAFVGSVPEDNGEYYFFNIGEKRFVAGGGYWGTQIVLNYAAEAMKLVPGSSGYMIDTPYLNGDGYHYLSYGGYVDTNSSGDQWEVIPVEGKTNVYNIARATGTDNANSEDGRYYLGFDGSGKYDIWYNKLGTNKGNPELESNQWMFITRDELNSLMLNATADNPVDATHLLSNPGFSVRINGTDNDKWICNTDAKRYGVTKNGSIETQPDYVYEGLRSTFFDLFQEVEDDALIPGVYTLTCTGYYRDGSLNDVIDNYLAGEEPQNLTNLVVSLYPNEEIGSIALPNIMDGNNAAPGLGYVEGENSICIPEKLPYYAAVDYFEIGIYRSEELTFEIPENNAGFIAIDVKKDSGIADDQIVVDNFRLTYLGEPVATGIKEVETEEEAATSAQKGIYNLNGQKLSTPVKGVNIINGKKVVVK